MENLFDFHYEHSSRPIGKVISSELNDDGFTTTVQLFQTKLKEEKKMKEKTKAIIIALTGTALGVTGLTCLGYSIHQVRSMRRVLLGSAQKINELSHVDIDQAVVDNMVKKAVHDQASEVVSKAANKAFDVCKTDMINRVRQVLQNKKIDIESQLAEEILQQISQADKNEIIEDVTEKASEMLVEKLGDDLDAELGRMGKIYKGLVAMIQ